MNYKESKGHLCKICERRYIFKSTMDIHKCDDEIKLYKSNKTNGIYYKEGNIYLGIGIISSEFILIETDDNGIWYRCDKSDFEEIET